MHSLMHPDTQRAAEMVIRAARGYRQAEHRHAEAFMNFTNRSKLAPMQQQDAAEWANENNRLLTGVQAAGKYLDEMIELYDRALNTPRNCRLARRRNLTESEVSPR